MPKSTTEEIHQSLFDKGLKIIMSAFNEQKKEYSKIIYKQEIEIKQLKEENNMYKNKLSILHKKLYTISRTFCDIQIDNEKDKEDNYQIQNYHNNTIQKGYNTFKNIYQKKNKKDSFNTQKSLNKNHNCSVQEEAKSSRFENRPLRTHQKNKNSSISHFTLKNYFLNDNVGYGNYMENLNIVKKKTILNDSNEDDLNKNKSYVIDTSKNISLNNFEESKSDRDLEQKSKISETFLNLKINKKENKFGISKIIANNNNNIPFITDNNKNNNGLNYINGEDIVSNKIKNDEIISSKSSNENEDLKENKERNNSSMYKKLNLFLEKCKVKLNALDYEKVIKLLKYYENDSSVEVKQKIKKIISNNKKLCKKFDDIFESS